jgi:hypothetical protein
MEKRSQRGGTGRGIGVWKEGEWRGREGDSGRLIVGPPVFKTQQMPLQFEIPVMLDYRPET